MLYTIKTFFRETSNIPTCIISLAVGAVPCFFKSTPIPLGVWVVTTVILLLTVWFMYARIYIIKNRIKEKSTLVFDINQFVRISENDIVLIGKNNILHMGVLVDIYHTEKKFEQRIASGYLFNIQKDNEMQQIKIIQWYIKGEMREEVMHNNVNYISNITIKPILKTYGGHENE